MPVTICFVMLHSKRAPVTGVFYHIIWTLWNK